MQKSFPELGLVSEDCKEMSWIQSILYFAGFQNGQSLEVLLNRTLTVNSYKAKSDYVRQPIPEAALEGIWPRLFDKEAQSSVIILNPYGGRMSEISESATPFPHRAGVIGKIQYLVYWSEEGTAATKKHVRRRTSVRQASVWGTKYFKNNFKRLVFVKTVFDPTNFFRNEQSIPPLSF
ncbi:hypothetical protein CMV_001479 [Castanea mollissima]|uniref:Berberine/berberine-like domain-containing protein n=1 Tax=Castanea mollissima TaxID=60419 RepID=A0A8J4RWJ8_9ROSI|nr:hypothetical protein CMV_001479 [Castanea mollissima]